VYTSNTAVEAYVRKEQREFNEAMERREALIDGTFGKDRTAGSL